MNFDTGVMSASSASIGPCASAGWNWGAPVAPQAPHVTVNATSTRISILLIVVTLPHGPWPSTVSLRPSARAIDRASPSVVQRLAPARVPGRREGSLHAPPPPPPLQRAPPA